MASNLRVDTILPSTGTNVAIGTASGSVTFLGDTDITTSGSVSIGGTLTYEDVTNVDSVGVITARSDLSIADKIVHTGDTNTAIRFPANDVISFERSGGEALRITTAGSILTNGATSEPLYPGYTTARKVQAEIKGAIDVGQTRHHGSLAINCTNENAALHLVRSQANNSSDVDAGLIAFTVYDGTDFHQCARIMASRDAAGGDNDTPGRLTFHTTADGASSATERLRIDSSGFIGAGTANPRRHFHLHNSASATVGFQMTNGNTGESNDSQGFQLKVGSDSHAEISQMENSYLAIFTNAAERLRILSDGKVGVNNSSPTARLHVSDSSFNIARFTRSGGQAGVTIEGNHSSESVYFSLRTLNNTANSGAVIEGVDASGNGTSWIKLYTENDTTNAGAISLHTRPASGSTTKRFEIDSNGDLLLYRFSALFGHAGYRYYNTLSGGPQVAISRANGNPFLLNRNSSDGEIVDLRRGWGAGGSIHVGTNSATYNTSSDYRLKENIVAISDGITRLKTLKPSRFNWKGDTNSTRDGFIAHEVTAVPEAITGTKDEVYSENEPGRNIKAGDPKYQGIDQSRLVPLLTAALQEAITKIETLESKVAALEGS